MSDDRRRNGTSYELEPIVIPIPTIPERRRPLQIAKPARPIQEDDLRAKMADALMALVPRVNELDDHLVENTAQLIVLSTAFNRMAERQDKLVEHVQSIADTARIRPKLPSISEHYNPDLTPAGGIRLDPDRWQGILQQLQNLQTKLDTKDAEARGAKTALEELHAAQQRRRESIRAWIASIGVAATILGGIIGYLIHR